MSAKDQGQQQDKHTGRNPLPESPGPLSTSTTTTTAAMNIRPPMVGVPCLDMCQVGPSSLMDCPAFHRRKAGTRNFPKMALMAKPSTTAARVFSRMGSIPLHLRNVLLLFSQTGSIPPPGTGERRRQTHIITYFLRKKEAISSRSSRGRLSLRPLPDRSHALSRPTGLHPRPGPWPGPGGWPPGGLPPAPRQ